MVKYIGTLGLVRPDEDSGPFQIVTGRYVKRMRLVGDDGDLTAPHPEAPAAAPAAAASSTAIVAAAASSSATSAAAGSSSCYATNP